MTVGPHGQGDGVETVAIPLRFICTHCDQPLEGEPLNAVLCNRCVKDLAR